MPFVIDYTALLSANSWTATPGAPTVVTYSFEVKPAEYLLAVGNRSFLNSFSPLSDAQKTSAQIALDVVAAASGLTFVEVKAALGDIQFGTYDFSLVPDLVGFAGLGYYPARSLEEDYAFDAESGGDILIDFDVDAFDLFLHEVGHAVGLQHPFDQGVQLRPDLDTRANTVMSYDDTFHDGPALGPLDVDALQYLYGPRGFHRNAAPGADLLRWYFDYRARTVDQEWGINRPRSPERPCET